MISNNKNAKVVTIFLLLILTIILNSQVFAANLELNVKFDGKKIEMTSETPDMTWTVENLLPGESEEIPLTIKNIGKKSVDVDFKAVVENGDKLVDILEIKVINKSDNSEIYSGKYCDLEKLNIKIDSGKSQEFKIITHMPIEAGNEYQDTECNIKLSFVARGKKDEVKPTENNTEEPPTKQPQEEEIPEEESPKDEVITDIIKPIQTGEGYVILAVCGLAVIAVFVLIVTFMNNKK